MSDISMANQLYSDITTKIGDFRSSIASSLQEVVELDLGSKMLLHNCLTDALVDPSCMIKLQAVIDYMYEKINIGNWKEVKLFIRKTITIASYFKLLAHLRVSNDLSDSLIKESFKIIDFGIVFGCPLDIEPKLLHKCAEILQSLNPEVYTEDYVKLPNIAHDKVIVERDELNAIDIEIIDCPSMEYFYKNYLLKQYPVIIENCMEHWPALTKWKDQNYFIKLAGMRTVSVELGSKYTDSDWTQKLMTIEEFIKDYIYQSNGLTGYLAQYQLFEQIPELKKDIIEPEYCCFSDSNDEVDVMAWYGPKGTVSPLHHDPKRNLLAQVVGEKQIFLYPPTDSEYLYPHEHELLNNTARVDPRNPDLNMYPKYKDAKAHCCVLRPGQMLFIPPKWWHFVESLSISFSVSFWWE